MRKYKIEILQNEYRDRTGKLHNEYHFGIQIGPEPENVFYLGGLIFPANKQYLFDDKALDVITKALAVRWGLIQPRQNHK